MSVSDANTRAMIDADILDCFALTLTQGARKTLVCFHFSFGNVPFAKTGLGQI
jgi:hypothetical protein